MLIHGGGNFDQNTIDHFVALAGGPGSRIVYIPTAEEEAKISDKNGSTGLFYGLNFTVLHTRDRYEANLDSFVSPILKANGVFINGGRQPRLATSYLDTKTHRELENLLGRGGVIVGSSAGATILGSFLVRNQGCPDYDPGVMIDPRYPTDGFAFIKNIAIDQHVSERGRENDLVDVVNSHPEILGIGLDENTAIHVIGNRFSVIGNGQVHVHDGKNPQYTLGKGATFDLPGRTTV